MIKGIGSGLEGITANFERFQQAAARIARPADPTLERDLVQTIAASRGAEASVKVARAADEMVGTLIDIVA